MLTNSRLPLLGAGKEAVGVGLSWRGDVAKQKPLMEVRRDKEHPWQ